MQPFTLGNFYYYSHFDLDGRVNLSHIINVKYSIGYSVKIFPNPFADHLTIQIDNDSEKQYVQLVVYNILGNQIYFSSNSIMEGFNELRLDLEDLEKGYYFVRVQTGSKILHSSKILKN